MSENVESKLYRFYKRKLPKGESFESYGVNRIIEEDALKDNEELFKNEYLANRESLSALYRGNIKDFKNERFKAWYFFNRRFGSNHEDSRKSAINQAITESKLLFKNFIPKKNIKLKKQKRR